MGYVKWLADFAFVECMHLHFESSYSIGLLCPAHDTFEFHQITKLDVLKNEMSLG